jgi:hypothetical protein
VALLDVGHVGAAILVFPLRVRIPAGVCGLTRDSDIRVDQLLAWDNALFRRDLGPAPEAVRCGTRFGGRCWSCWTSSSQSPSAASDEMPLGRRVRRIAQRM